MLDGHTSQLELPLVKLKDPPATLLTLVTNAHKERRLRGVLHNQLDEGHNQDIITLARLVAIYREVNHCILRQLHLLTDLSARQSLEHLRLEAVKDYINGAIHALILQALLPIRREGKDALRLHIEGVNVSLELRRVHLINIDPGLEVLRNTRLVHLHQKLAYD